MPSDEFLQCATIRQTEGTTYRAHRHIVQERNEPEWIAQEAWVVLHGNIHVTLYDLDNSVLHTDVLEQGDMSLTLMAGHNYLFMGEGTVLELKVGKYLGQVRDKTFIDE